MASLVDSLSTLHLKEAPAVSSAPAEPVAMSQEQTVALSMLRNEKMNVYKLSNKERIAYAIQAGAHLTELIFKGQDDELSCADVARVVAACSNLKELRFKRCSSLTDAVAQELIKLPQLATLDLSGCQKITNKLLVTLEGARSLRHLFLLDCPKVTYDAIEKLRLVNKNLDIA
jgi:hypothetical protein